MTENRRRMVVTGRGGQVVLSLLERGKFDKRFEIIPLGRPELDLSAPDRLEAALRRASPDIIVSAAAYTAVDKAEKDEEAATVINAQAAGVIAATAKSLGVPVVHISTDFVFDGQKPTPYVESDPAAPINAYGRSKLAGERAVTAATANLAILRTAWVYSPFGKNFLKTMLMLAENRDQVSVVDDQLGNPTSAFDIADGILAVAMNLLGSDAPELRGVFHMAGAGYASWADFAAEIFAQLARLGGMSVLVDRISAAEYPTLAKRPANSRLDCSKLASAHGVVLPEWRTATATVLKKILIKDSVKRSAIEEQY